MIGVHTLFALLISECKILEIKTKISLFNEAYIVNFGIPFSSNTVIDENVVLMLAMTSTAFRKVFLDNLCLGVVFFAVLNEVLYNLVLHQHTYVLVICTCCVVLIFLIFFKERERKTKCHLTQVLHNLSLPKPESNRYI